MSLHVETTPASAEANPVSRRALHGDARRGHGARARGARRPPPRRPERRLRAQRPEPAAPPGRAATTGSTATAWCTPSTSRTARRPTATAGCAPRASSPSATPAARSGAASSSRSAPTRRTRPRRTRRTPTCCSTATACSRCGTGRASRTRSTRVTLETLGPEDFGGTLRCEVSAHAKVDEATGELMFFDFGVKPPYMRYGVVGSRGHGAALRRRSTCRARACRTTWRSPSATRS